MRVTLIDQGPTQTSNTCWVPKMAPIGFYAYASESGHLTETIESAIKSINKRDIAQIKSWRELKIGGKIVIRTILNRIKDADLFLCDLTGLNPNVLFELGYAIGLRKRVWLTLDSTKATSAQQVSKLDIVAGFGYRAHTNHDALTTQFLRDCPFADLDTHILSGYASLIDSKLKSPPTNDVFYIPSSVESTAVKRLCNYFSSLKEQNGRRVVVDDQLENSFEPLTWYLRNILDANAVVAHLDDIGSDGARINNARCSLLAGIALAFERQVLLIAPSPFDPPFDYRHLLVEYQDARHCKSAVEKWLRPIFMTRLAPRPTPLDPELTLLAFHIGETTAENEELELRDYFVPTAAYSAGTKSKMGIFVGRKGTGKTANLYQLREYFSGESQNLVVTIKPLAFRIAAFARLLDEFFPHPDLAADFIERIWRSIIYAEIAVALSRRIEKDTRYRDPTADEVAVISHVNKHSDFVDADFAGRIDLIRALVAEVVGRGDSPKAALHTIAAVFSQPLVDAYSSIFRPFQRIVILVDNLDKAWGVTEDLSVQTQLILSLLDFQNTIHSDLEMTKGDIRILVFLREDIYTRVMENAYEPDKVRLGLNRVAWPSRSQLIHILERRFRACSPNLAVAAIWDDLFCAKTAGVGTKDYLLRHTMPRPRDLIHVVRTSIDYSVGRSHSRIESDDLDDALKEYYQFLLDNMVAEYGVYMPRLRDIIQAFYGTRIRQTQYQLMMTVRHHARPAGGFLKVIEFLFRVSFLGIERQGRVKFVYTNDEAKLLIPLLRRRLRWHDLRRTQFVIHPAFHAGLDVTDVGR